MSNNIPVKNKINTDDLIKVERFRKNIRNTAPHKHHHYFEIVFLTAGTGEHWIDGVQYSIKPEVLFFITQDQVHNWDLRTEPEGFVLILKNAFIEKSLDRELKMLLYRLNGIPCIYPEHEPGILPLFELLAEEHRASTEMTLHIIEGLLKALLAKILNSARQEPNRAAARTDLYHTFLGLLHTGAPPVKMKVADFAARLNTTPQNLNAACRKAVNKSAAEVLADHIMNEAKRLLRYTNKTVSQISLSLNFSDPSHFVKFFKRIAGHTPQSFRSL